MFGLPDEDNDTLRDPWESVVIDRLSPIFHLSEHEPLLTSTEDRVALFGRVSPYPDTTTPVKYLGFWYVMAWSRDYGKYGLSAHNGDTEPFFVLWRIVDNRTLVLESIFIHAHEGCNERHDLWNSTGLSCNQASVCNLIPMDMSRECLCSTLKFSDNRIALYPSEGKHALYPSPSACNSVTLEEISLDSDPLCRILRWINSLLGTRTGAPPGEPPIEAGCIANSTPRGTLIAVRETCEGDIDHRYGVPVYHLGEPDHLFIRDLSVAGFFNEDIEGRMCGGQLRFLGGRDCEGGGATPVYYWISHPPSEW